MPFNHSPQVADFFRIVGHRKVDHLSIASLKECVVFVKDIGNTA